MPQLHQRQLRKLAFEVSVLADRDFITDDVGIHLLPRVTTTPTQPVVLTWELAAQALAHHPESTSAAHLRQALLGILTDIDLLMGRSSVELARAARPYALPTTSGVHPGPAWVCQPVLGGALDVGLAFAAHTDQPEDASQPTATDAVQLVSPYALQTVHPAWRDWWPKAQHYLETIGQAAVTALSPVRPSSGVTTSSRRPQAVLHPCGDADVLTLLGASCYRQALAQRDHSGLCAVAVPLRRRGWIDLSSLDPAFIPTAYELTDPPERGFPRPVLVTADEVVFRG